MLIDKYRSIVLEQNPIGDPGRFGEGMAETGRWQHLEIFNKPDLIKEPFEVERVARTYRAFKVTGGYVRHPLSIWRENETSGDQLKPIYLMVNAWGLHEERLEIERHLESNFYRTGDGNLIHPSFWAAIKRANGLQNNFYDLAILGQVKLMQNLAYRWNDEQWKRREWPLEKTESSSADYLNLLHLIVQSEMFGSTWSSRKAKSLIDPKVMMSKIESYYAVEPNAFVLPLYAQAVKKIWSVPS